jgi:5-methylthioadenosine/S-adenosylhomocysteine deaminase
MTTDNGRQTTDKAAPSGPVVDLLIAGGLVLTLNDRDEIFSEGAVAVTGDRIVAVGDASTLLRAVQPRERLDARDCLVMPGLINLHTHAAMTCFRGLADDLPLETWLHEHIFPAEAKHVDADNVYWGTLLAVAEMIRSGTTTFCDGYFCEDGAARAVLAAGIRAVCAQGVIDFPAPGIPDPSKNLETAEDFVRRWRGRSPRLTPSIFCHSPYTCSAETLRRGKALCLEHRIPFQIHVAETSGEVDESLRRHGCRPVAYLKNLELLDSGTICHHAAWVDGHDIALLAGSGAGVSHNPESNMKLATGVAPLPEMLGAGVRVGLGTDGCASNNNLDMLREMDTAAKLHKVHRLDPTVMAARSVARMATSGGAAALGMAEDLASLAPAKKADLIIIDLDQPHLTPLYEPCSHLVYAARGADVRDVIIDGRVVMRNRDLLTIDLERAMAEVRGIAKKIRP